MTSSPTSYDFVFSHDPLKPSRAAPRLPKPIGCMGFHGKDMLYRTCARRISATHLSRCKRIAVVIGNKRRGCRARNELISVHYVNQKVSIVSGPNKAVPCSALLIFRRVLSRIAIGNQFGHHRVVKRDFITRLHASIHSDPGPCGCVNNLIAPVLGKNPDADLPRTNEPQWRVQIVQCLPALQAGASPRATRICHSTRSYPVTISVTGCST